MKKSIVSLIYANGSGGRTVKIVRFVFLIVCICLLMSCSSNVPANTQMQDAETNTTSAAELNMPDAMKEYAEDPRVQWMAGMVVALENAEMIQGISEDGFEVYSDPGEEVQAAIIVQNGLDKTQSFDLMVFADGVPVEFQLNGEVYKSYSVDLTPWQKMIEIEFEKDFLLNMGRLDFVMSYGENPQEDYHMVNYTVWIDLAEEALQPVELGSTVEQRTGVKGRYSGGSYNAWFWNEGIIPEDSQAVGQRTITIREQEKILLEAIASKAGQYRTVVVVNGMPIEFEIDGVKKSYLDWKSTGTNMLQVPIALLEEPSAGCICTITTPLTTENRAEYIVGSGMIELIANAEE